MKFFFTEIFYKIVFESKNDLGNYEEILYENKHFSAEIQFLIKVKLFI